MTEAQREAQRRWREKNPERSREIHRASAERLRKNDPEGYRQRGIAYRLANPEKVRKWSLRHYGILPETFDRIYDEQGGRCAICRDEIPRLGKGRHLDHCHQTNRIRGILCTGCNLGLGNFRDRVDALRAAAAYVETADTGLVVAHPERLNRPNHRTLRRQKAA